MSSLSDLHRHLDGSLRYRTLQELAGAHARAVPPVEELRFRDGMGLGGALQRFELTLSVLQDPAALRRVAAECCEDAAAEGVSTLELRFAPQLHGDLEAAVDAVLDGAAGRAGILLCALYGEEPALVERLVRCAEGRRQVVGIDLAAGPLTEHRYGLADYAEAFARAARAGLGRTVHAGEGRPPDEIRQAIEQLGAQRIGHGTTLLDDEEVTELVLSRGVVIEACITSNVHTGVIAAASEHPLPRWLARGVRVCVCADNTLFSATDAPREHALARALPGMTEELFQRVRDEGHRAAFARR